MRKIFVILILFGCVTFLYGQCNDTLTGDCIDGSQRILRRPKRYLVYPEGSSLQLCKDFF